VNDKTGQPTAAEREAAVAKFKRDIGRMVGLMVAGRVVGVIVGTALIWLGVNTALVTLGKLPLPGMTYVSLLGAYFGARVLKASI
jgi:hypothetical protein